MAPGATRLCQDRNLHFPLAADFEPKGAVARLFKPIGTKMGSASGRFLSLTGTV